LIPGFAELILCCLLAQQCSSWEPRSKGSKQYGMGTTEEDIWSDPKHGNTVLFRVVDFGSDSERTATLVYSPLSAAR
jgi:hypothetical protein